MRIIHKQRVIPCNICFQSFTEKTWEKHNCKAKKRRKLARKKKDKSKRLIHEIKALKRKLTALQNKERYKSAIAAGFDPANGITEVTLQDGSRYTLKQPKRKQPQDKTQTPPPAPKTILRKASYNQAD